jgi:hypothetical protein
MAGVSFPLLRCGAGWLGRSWLWLLTAATAQPAMRDALTATQLLSGLFETRLVRFELPGAPRKLHSVVIKFDGVLWLYTPGRGTCPLGPAPRDDRRINDEISARLRRADPALDRLEVVARPLPPAAASMLDSLRNACFAGCLLQLASLYARGEPVDEAGVIFLSEPAGTAPAFTAVFRDVGHSLLVYRSGEHWWLLDPAQADSPVAYRAPQVAAELDPVLTAYARRANYPTSRAQYHRFSSAALRQLADEVAWRMRLSASSPEFDR